MSQTSSKPILLEDVSVTKTYGTLGWDPIYVIIFEFSRYISLICIYSYVYEFYSSKVTKSFNFFLENISIYRLKIARAWPWNPNTVLSCFQAYEYTLLWLLIHYGLQTKEEWSGILYTEMLSLSLSLFKPFMIFPLKDTYMQTTTARATKGKVKPLQIFVLSCALVWLSECNTSWGSQLKYLSILKAAFRPYLTNFAYVLSKITDHVLAVDRRLSAVSLPNINYWQTSVSSHSVLILNNSYL